MVGSPGGEYRRVIESYRKTVDSVNIRTRIFGLLLFCHFLLDITHFLYIFLHHFVHKHAPKDII